jgi:predicted nucleotidyltransferase
MTHESICALYDTARAAVERRDWKDADDARNAAYAINEPLSWFMAEEIGRLIAEARGDVRNSEANPFLALAVEERRAREQSGVAA